MICWLPCTSYRSCLWCWPSVGYMVRLSRARKTVRWVTASSVFTLLGLLSFCWCSLGHQLCSSLPQLVSLVTPAKKVQRQNWCSSFSLSTIRHFKSFALPTVPVTLIPPTQTLIWRVGWMTTTAPTPITPDQHSRIIRPAWKTQIIQGMPSYWEHWKSSWTAGDGAAVMIQSS